MAVCTPLHPPAEDSQAKKVKKLASYLFSFLFCFYHYFFRLLVQKPNFGRQASGPLRNAQVPTYRLLTCFTSAAVHYTVCLLDSSYFFFGVYLPASGEKKRRRKKRESGAIHPSASKQKFTFKRASQKKRRNAPCSLPPVGLFIGRQYSAHRDRRRD